MPLKNRWRRHLKTASCLRPGDRIEFTFEKLTYMEEVVSVRPAIFDGVFDGQTFAKAQVMVCGLRDEWNPELHIIPAATRVMFWRE